LIFVFVVAFQYYYFLVVGCRWHWEQFLRLCLVVPTRLSLFEICQFVCTMPCVTESCPFGNLENSNERLCISNTARRVSSQVLVGSETQYMIVVVVLVVALSPNNTSCSDTILVILLLVVTMEYETRSDLKTAPEAEKETSQGFIQNPPPVNFVQWLRKDKRRRMERKG
jgi:hypothetical protein